jgi:hypothetical protein
LADNSTSAREEVSFQYMAPIRLGDLLLKANAINESQLKAALAEQQRWGGRLGETLVRMNILSEDMLVKALSKQLGIVAVNLASVQTIPPHVKSKIPAEIARNLVAVPIQVRDEGKSLIVAMAEPQNLKSLDTLRSVSKCKIIAQVAGTSAIQKAFSRFYEGEAEMGSENDVGDSGGFKLVDSQGHTLIKNIDELRAQEEAKKKAQPPAPQRAPAPRASGEISMAAARSPSELLKAIEDAQRKEVAALKGMVELLIEKGVFTRDEYLAKVKR